MQGLDRAIDLICQDPQIGRVARGEVMTYRIKSFPYSLLYIDREAHDAVYVVALPHDRQRDDYWIHRLEDVPPDEGEENQDDP